MIGFAAVNSSKSDIATIFFLDDVPHINVPATRLRSILERTFKSLPISAQQQEFLRQRGYDALLRFALGEIDMESFCIQAQREQDVRIQATDLARKEAAEITDRKNAVLFAEQERKMARRKKLRELPDKYGLPFIDQVDLKRVNKILGLVAEGKPIDDDDLGWLACNGDEYWTDELRRAHHENFAERLTNEWRQTRNAWKASSACGHWRKAKCPADGLAVAKAALDHKKVTNEKQRSALLTTGGGAHRDLRHREEAVQFGKEAHSLTPEDFRPCTLLGAVHIEMGAYSEGAEWYEKAEARGARPEKIDGELRSILSSVSHEKRKQIEDALKALDASRYRGL
jgi:tetratricopeptide (TPR) repeat protein